MHYTVQKKANHSPRHRSARQRSYPQCPGSQQDRHADTCDWHHPCWGPAWSWPQGMVDQGTSHWQTVNMAVPVVGAEELPNPPALWLSHNGQASSRGYALLRGQLVSGCGWAWGCLGCGELWWFFQSGVMVPAVASGQKSPSASSCTPSMGTSSITFPT